MSKEVPDRAEVEPAAHQRLAALEALARCLIPSCVGGALNERRGDVARGGGDAGQLRLGGEAAERPARPGRRRRGRAWALWESPMRCCPVLGSTSTIGQDGLPRTTPKAAGVGVRAGLMSGVGGDFRALVGPICPIRCRNPQPSRSRPLWTGRAGGVAAPHPAAVRRTRRAQSLPARDGPPPPRALALHGPHHVTKRGTNHLTPLSTARSAARRRAASRRRAAAAVCRARRRSRWRSAAIPGSAGPRR